MRKNFYPSRRITLTIGEQLVIYRVMQHPPIPSEPPQTAPKGAEAFARLLLLIVNPLLQHINNRIPSLGRFGQPLHDRITRARNRLLRLFARIGAGTYPLPRAPRPNHRPIDLPADAPRRAGGPPAPYLPRRRGWVIHVLGYHAAGFASQLQHLLDDPATRALLDTAPPHAQAAAGRALRPLGRLLGLTLAATLQPPPPPAKPRPARPPRPKPAPLPPLLPFYPQRRPRPMPFPDFAKKTRL